MQVAYQDGADFYDSESGQKIAHYGSMVTSDYDAEGAEMARAQFMKDHPDYIMEGPGDGPDDILTHYGPGDEIPGSSSYLASLI